MRKTLCQESTIKERIKIPAPLKKIGKIPLNLVPLVLNFKRYLKTDLTPDDVDYVVVFGAGLTPAGDPTPELKLRLDIAAKIAGDSKYLILSGTKRPGYDEPASMGSYLMTHYGLHKDQFIYDTKGISTQSTIRVLQKKKQYPAALVSTDYHIPRIAFLAHCADIPATFVSSPRSNNILGGLIPPRECLAQLKDLKSGLELKALSTLPGMLSPKRRAQLLFYRQNKYFPNLKHPTSFTDKIIWSYLSGACRKHAPYADKLEIRSYVAPIAGSNHIVPILKIYDTADKVKSSNIPPRCVLKPTNSSGDYIFFDCRYMNVSRIMPFLKKWETTNVFHKTGEPQYLDIPFHILAEQNIDELLVGFVKTWRFYCFKGRTEFQVILGDGKRTWQLTRDLQDLSYSVFRYDNKEPFIKPTFYDSMLETAEKLAEPFEFVRVDFYVGDNDWLFSELTFTPTAGIMGITPREMNDYLGSLIDLEKL